MHGAQIVEKPDGPANRKVRASQWNPFVICVRLFTFPAAACAATICSPGRLNFGRISE
jgi:hypothetical protein